MTPSFLLLTLACHRGGLDTPRGGLDNPEHVTTDLLRSEPGGEKVFVEATLPDGSTGLFLVDTGAGVSAIRQEVADRLGLMVMDSGRQVAGLGGQAAWLEATVPWIEVGGFAVANVEVAVEVPGLPEYAGWMELDGILGNNFWRESILIVDYPADRLELLRPDQALDLPKAEPMIFDGNHAVTRLVLYAGEEGAEALRKEVLLELDTGAHGVMLSGVTGMGLEPVSTEGEEPILGLGASEMIPVSAFYRRTRRVPLQAVELGGARVSETGPATWLNYEFDASSPMAAMPGLAGHAVLHQHRVVFDYQGGRFALLESEGPPRQLDGHQHMLERELSYGAHDPDRALNRARLRIPLEQYKEAAEDLDQWLKKHPGDPEGVALRAELHRVLGQPEAAIPLLQTLSPKDLLDQHQVIALVNSLILEGRPEEALAVAEGAAALEGGDGEAQVALSDALLALGRPKEARMALAEAARRIENPDAELKRRAHIALSEGDPYAALAHLRRRLLLYPSDGETLWFYALLVSDRGISAEITTFNADLNHMRARLHPEAVPWDFLAAALRLTGAAPSAVKEAMDKGIRRDCAVMLTPAQQENCEGWYLAMAGSDTARAMSLVRTALERDPHRSDYLDTLAVILLERGDYKAAAEAALQAARLGPDRFYLLWQYERLRVLAARPTAE